MDAIQSKWLLACALGALVIGAASCRGENEDSGAGSASAGVEGPNLLLVTLDTTRADRLGSYGHAAAETPRLDGLAAAGMRFDRAYAQAPITLPTHASLFTGTFPPEHGIHDNGRVALGPELTTLAEIFATKGFRTGAFVSAIALDGSFGLGRGFEVYDDQLSRAKDPGASALDRPASRVLDSALAWLKEDDGPFFLWTHFYDPHAPYAPPADFRLGDPYDGEIAYVDAQLGRLLGWLDAEGLREDTLIVVLADHGESLGEKGEHTHASLIYEGTQRIPWVMVWPGTLPAGQTSNTLVQQVDLLPTLMELYDWSVPSQVSGRSLAPLLRGETLEETAVYMESEYCALNFGWSSLRAVVRGPWKYIQAPSPELYDLLGDPTESKNLAAERPELVAELQAELDALLASMGSYSASTLQVEEGMARGLSHLGYVQGSVAESAQGEHSSISPIERIEYLELYHGAVGLANQGRFAEMIAPLEQVVAACPESAGFRALLGDAYARSRRWEEARVQLERALELSPNYDPAHYYLGSYHEARGESTEALAAFRENLRLRPEYVPAREAVARLLMGQQDFAGALKQYESIVALDPNESRHWVNRSSCEARLGLNADRKRSIEQAITQAKGDLGVLDFCAWVLATANSPETRDGARALELATLTVRETHSQLPSFLDTLAAAHAEVGQFEEAIRRAEQARELAASVDLVELVEQISTHLERFRQDLPVRE